MDLPWSVVEVVGGRLEEDFTDLSDLAGLADVDDYLLSVFLDFFSDSPLKPEVVWPSTTPTTDTSAGSTRVGLRVSNALAGVDDLASFFSFLSLYEGVDNWAFCSEDRASQCAQTEWRSKPAIMWPQPPRRWLGEDIIVYNIYGSK